MPSATFETVLEQANALSAADRRRLAKVLGKSNDRKRPKTKVNDAEVIGALRAWVDEMEITENPKPNSSAKFAQRIRKGNDRGYSV